MVTRSFAGRCLKFMSLLLAAFVTGSVLRAAVIAEETEVAVDPTDGTSGYTAVMYDNPNGLPTSEANALAQTSDGALYIGGYSGLIRYDGNSFERVDSITSGITSVVSLYIDSRDRIWVGTNDNGVILMDKGNYTRFGKEQGLRSLTIKEITETSTGEIYIGTAKGVAVIDNDLKMAAIDDSRLNDLYVRQLRVGADDVIYGLSNDNILFTIKDRAITGYYTASELRMENMRSILPDPEDPSMIYIGCSRFEIYHIKTGVAATSFDMISTKPCEYINDLEYYDGEIWICTDNGICVYKDGKVSVVQDVPMTHSIEDILVDYQGNYWFASSRQGVMKIVPNMFTDVFAKYDMEEMVVNGTCMYKGKLFIGTDEGLTVIADDGPMDSYPLSEVETASGNRLNHDDLIKMLRSSKIRSVIDDSQGRLWISTFGDLGLVCVDGDKAVCYRSSDGMPSKRIRTICERSDGSYAVAATGGVVILQDGKISKIYNDADGIDNLEVLTVAEADNGRLLVGTDGGGLFAIEKDGSVKKVTVDNGLKSDVVMRIRYDAKRNISWFVTSNSIGYLGADLKVTNIDQFPYSNNFDLYESSNESMWILSSNGIYVVPVADLMANGEIHSTFYSKDNGLTNLATANSYSELTEDGDLYIAGNGGVTKVNVYSGDKLTSSWSMNVPYVEADGVRIYPDENGRITLPAGTTKLTVNGYIYNYSLTNPVVSYCLEGVDREPVKLQRSELTPVDYTNLKGGSYTFVLKVFDASGNEAASINVVIVKEKAIYEQIWFIVLCAVVAVAIIVAVVAAFVHYKLAKLRKKEAEDRILIREITEAFAKTIDMKDNYTNGHSFRVADYTARLTRELGYDEDTVEKYYNIALLHDIGKIGISKDVLNKNGKLTDEEFAQIKSHAALGHDVLKGISILPELAIGAWAHHERPDGKGYPRGLKGEDMPRVAQIIAVADCFDAMYSDRPYRKRMNFEKAVSIIKEVSGTQLTADVVDAFLRLVDKGEMRAPDDNGGGTMDDINNIRKKFDE